MNIFEVADLVYTIASFMPDIRVLRLNHALDEIIREHPEYTLWQKCEAANSIYSHGVIKMFTGRAFTEHDAEQAVKHDNITGRKIFSRGWIRCGNCDPHCRKVRSHWHNLQSLDRS